MRKFIISGLVVFCAVCMPAAAADFRDTGVNLAHRLLVQYKAGTLTAKKYVQLAKLTLTGIVLSDMKLKKDSKISSATIHRIFQTVDREIRKKELNPRRA